MYSTQGKKPLSELAKANVEALASGESSAGYFKATESTVVSSQETPYATIITTKTVTNCIPGGRLHVLQEQRIQRQEYPNIKVIVIDNQIDEKFIHCYCFIEHGLFFMLLFS